MEKKLFCIFVEYYVYIVYEDIFSVKISYYYLYNIVINNYDMISVKLIMFIGYSYVIRCVIIYFNLMFFIVIFM